ncbi:amino acid transporter, transmembrane domain-containing protein [Artemisia annua]|uniref:Amino acid transporter, transmembrane domain-containing protein n=1 Tax=Artemisia annua TaxID=35608 RepID=A0A2U1L4B3_ARTAN|nr:amino acid transporter, transmembrane domain-containing protein [Artemisia annua]
MVEKFPDSGFLKRYYELKLPFLPDFELNLFWLCFRTSYVVGNVHSAKKGGSLEPKMGASANFQRCFNGDFHIGSNWITFGTQ